MNNRESIPLKLINTTPGPNEINFKLRQSARFGRGPTLPDSSDFLRACAMVDTALDLNQSIRPLWLDIIGVWDKPGCAAYASWTQTNDNLKTYVELLLSTGKANFSFVARDYNKWQVKFRHDADVTYLNGLIDNFVLKAFNGPINPVLRRVLGLIEYLRAPKYKVKVTPVKTLPELKQAIAFLSWCDNRGIDLREVDQLRMGADYKVVTSGKKPSTTYGRKRKPEITKMMHNAGLSFISDESIYNMAKKWYYARVIRGSVTEAASDYGIANHSTFENEIKSFDHIAGLH